MKWVLDIVFGDMLGVPFEVAYIAEAQVLLESEGRRLVMHSGFPDLHCERQHWAAQIPPLPLADFDTAALPGCDLDLLLPTLFGAAHVDVSENEIHCEIDILGSIFFMLSRFEEMALPDRDRHDRFPATASLAWRATFLYRPIVDEYVEVLWAMMKRLWPSLTRIRRQGRIKVSCDVDQPFDRVGTSPKKLLRSVAGDLGRRRDPGLAARRARNFMSHRKGNLQFDPYYTFDWYMDACERHGHQAAFYFIADHSAGTIDGTYEINEPRVLDLLRKVSRRGHEIGLHGSYNTFHDPQQIAKERQRLTAACESAGLDIEICGNRQHYLRWDIGRTPDHLDAAGFGYDTTGSFADRPGFRYGTSHPFSMWSWTDMAPLRMKQHPLVLMECSVILKKYLGMGHSIEALELTQDLKRRSLRYGGDFTLLWHNSELLTQKDRAFFQTLLG
ncbi:MAG: polysaccharide deacetylase family protein [Mesorhizobium sp.]